MIVFELALLTTWCHIRPAEIKVTRSHSSTLSREDKFRSTICGSVYRYRRAIFTATRSISLLILFFFCANVTVYGFEPNLLRDVRNVTVAKGKDAVFTCVVHDLGGHKVSTAK